MKVLKKISLMHFLCVFPFVVDMGGELGFRRLGFLCLVMALIFNICRRQVAVGRLDVAFLLFFLCAPMLTLIISLGRVADPGLAISQVSVFVFACLYYLKRKFDRDFSLNEVNASFVLVGLFYCLMLCLYFSFSDIYLSITRYMHAVGAGYAGERAEGEIKIANVYLKSSLFMIFTFCCLLSVSRFLSFLMLVGVVVTTSKSLFLTKMVVMFVYFSRKPLMLLFFLLLTMGLSAIFYDSIRIYFYYLSEGLSSDSVTVTTRALHFRDYVEMVGDAPLRFLFGFGPGSEFFSHAFGKTVSNIEIDHFNVARKFGILWFLGLLSVVLYVAVNTWLVRGREAIGPVVGLALSFLLAGTNPVLLSPVFFIILIDVYFWGRNLKVSAGAGSV